MLRSVSFLEKSPAVKEISLYPGKGGMIPSKWLIDKITIINSLKVFTFCRDYSRKAEKLIISTQRHKTHADIPGDVRASCFV